MKRSGLMAGASLFKNCIQHFHACTGFQICYSSVTMISIDLSLLGRYINYSQHQLQWYTETYMNQQMPLTSLSRSKTNKHGQSLEIIRQGTQWNNSWRNPNILSCPCSTAGTPCRAFVAMAFFSHVADRRTGNGPETVARDGETRWNCRVKPKKKKLIRQRYDSMDSMESMESMNTWYQNIYFEGGNGMIRLEWSGVDQLIGSWKWANPLIFNIFRSWSSESETDISCGFWNILKHWLIFTSCTGSCVDTISAVAILISFNVQQQMVQMIQSAIAPWKIKTHHKYKINRVLSNK